MLHPFSKDAILTIIIPNRSEYSTIEKSLLTQYGEKNYLIEGIDISDDPIILMVNIQKSSSTIINFLKNSHPECRFLRSIPKFKMPQLMTLIFGLYGSIGVTIGIIKFIFSS